MSSNDIGIKVEHLSKMFQMYNQPQDRLKQFILPRLQRLVGSPPKLYFHEFWALHAVSFEVKKGETVGIVGRNGSGKSTLLQLICGTLTPTGGFVQTNGRVAALLELGSGFNPEFTGRENVYLNGAVLGLSTTEINERFDDIAAFADIGEFIEQPVKMYSSGMMVRLAFAVAINVDAQILVVDEALAVGDELFQRKCYSRIESLKDDGATILFVSHSGTAIIDLCDRAMLLEAGEKLAMGIPKQIVGSYQKLLYAPADKQAAICEQIMGADDQSTLPDPIMQTDDQSTPPLQSVEIPKDELQQYLENTSFTQEEYFDPYLTPSSTIEYESHGVYIDNPVILNLKGERVNNLFRDKIYRYTYTVRFVKSVSNVRFGMMIRTTSGIELGGGVSAGSPKDSLPYVEAGVVYSVEFRFRCTLNWGVYFMNAGVVGDENGTEIYLHRLIDIAMFRVIPDTDNFLTGMIDFGCHPEIVRL